MDLKYVMLKNRYRFVHNNKAILYDVTKLQLYKKELSMFIKELYIYNISFKDLAKEKPRPIVKDELLNLAIICTETEELKRLIKLHRSVPSKELCSISGKSQKYFERWGNYIIAFFIIYNNNYTSISSYLNVKEVELFSKDKDDIPPAPETAEENFAGIALKVKSKRCYLLTPNGDFIVVEVHDSVTFGELYSGKEKKERDYYKLPAKIFIVALALSLVLFFYMYNRKDRTVIIRGKLSITMETNKWDRVINLTAFNKDSYKIKKSVKTFNRTLDSSILNLLEVAVQSNYISETSPTTIYISVGDNEYPNLEKTKEYILNSKLPIIINYNGKNLSSDENLKESAQ